MNFSGCASTPLPSYSSAVDIETSTSNVVERKDLPYNVAVGSKYRPLRARSRLSRGSRSGSKPYTSIALEERRLLHSCAIGCIESVNCILKESPHASVQISDHRGRTPLHFSCAKGCDAITRLLLERGADPSCKDINGNTPLHLACCGSHIRIVTLLLYHGASPASRDFLGRKPVELALARLKLITYSLKSSKEKSNKLEADVADIIGLLKECSKSSSTGSFNAQLHAICDGLETASISASTPEVTNVNKLLGDLEALQLDL